MRAGLPAALALWLAAAAPAAAQDADPEAPAAPSSAVFMSDEALTEAFSGAEYEGCYPDGSPWAERTAEDGALYDTLRLDEPLVGSWWVENGQICYFYPAQDVIACWLVIRDEDDFYFYTPETREFGGATDCGDPVA